MIPIRQLLKDVLLPDIHLDSRNNSFWPAHDICHGWSIQRSLVQTSYTAMQPYTPEPICGEYQVQTTFSLAAGKHSSTKGRKQQKEADQCRGKIPRSALCAVSALLFASPLLSMQHKTLLFVNLVSAFTATTLHSTGVHTPVYFTVLTEHVYLP